MAPPAPDLIRRAFTAEAPGKRFVGDITYLPTEEGWLYLSTVIDLHNREVVGHAMAPYMRTELVSAAIDLAVGRGRVHPEAVFHSDRGSQYTSTGFRKTLKATRIRSSMGCVGSCYGDAVAESFFATLKSEIGTKVWPTRQAARQDVFAYLAYYNQYRLHSTNGYRTPVETRLGYRDGHALAA